MEGIYNFEEVLGELPHRGMREVINVEEIGGGSMD